MKICNIPYETANQRHPEAVALILREAARRLKRSKAKNKGKDLSELLWSYKCCVRGRCATVQEFFNSTSPVGPKATLEEMVAQRLELTFTCLTATMPGSYGAHPVANPPEVAVWAREEFLRWGYVSGPEKDHTWNS